MQSSVIEVDMFEKHRGAVVDPDDIIAVQPVAVLVEIVDAFGAVIPFRRQDRLPQLLGLEALGFGHRAGQHAHRVVTKGGAEIGDGLVSGLILRREGPGRIARNPG